MTAVGACAAVPFITEDAEFTKDAEKSDNASTRVYKRPPRP